MTHGNAVLDTDARRRKRRRRRRRRRRRSFVDCVFQTIPCLSHAGYRLLTMRPVLQQKLHHGPDAGAHQMVVRQAARPVDGDAKQPAVRD